MMDEIGVQNRNLLIKGIQNEETVMNLCGSIAGNCKDQQEIGLCKDLNWANDATIRMIRD